MKLITFELTFVQWLAASFSIDFVVPFTFAPCVCVLAAEMLPFHFNISTTIYLFVSFSLCIHTKCSQNKAPVRCCKAKKRVITTSRPQIRAQIDGFLYFHSLVLCCRESLDMNEMVYFGAFDFVYFLLFLVWMWKMCHAPKVAIR